MFWQLCLLALALGSTVYGHDEGECEAEQSQPWSYGGANGPEHWYKVPGYEACDGENQSPINIITDEAVLDAKLGPIHLTRYAQPIEDAEVVNNGHTVQVTPKDGVKRMIENSGILGETVFQQLHFHWGSDWHVGSEHAIDELRRPMEMHLVHKNPEGNIAVIGVLFVETRHPNKNLEPITKVLRSIKHKGQSTALASSLNLTSLFPKSRDSYYRYSGSLTTPGCNEGVSWTVLKDPITIGADQMHKFRCLKSTEDSLPKDEQCLLENNFRPLQDINDRTVYSSTPNTD